MEKRGFKQDILKMRFERFMIMLWFMLWTYYNIVGIDVIRADNIGITALQDNPGVINWKGQKWEYLLFVNNNKMAKTLWTSLKIYFSIYKY